MLVNKEICGYPALISYFKSLLSPDDSAIVVVDGAVPGLSAGSGDDVQTDPLDMHGFVAAMLSLGVPVIETAMDGTATLTRGAAEGRAGPILRDVANPWSEPAFRTAVDAAGRSRLVVLGACAETTLTQTALIAASECSSQPPTSECCDDRFNPSNTCRWPSVCVARKQVSGHPWDRSAMRMTTPCARASSPRSNASCSIGASSKPRLRGPNGHLRVHRGMVQSRPPPFGARIPVPNSLRKEAGRTTGIC